MPVSGGVVSECTHTQPGVEWRVRQSDLEARMTRLAIKPTPYETTEVALKRVLDAAPPLTEDQARALACEMSEQLVKKARLVAADAAAGPSLASSPDSRNNGGATG
ncbi:hypothetical protein [Gordonia sp. (in: high G+C Gram-positive bacteria)]|uniref:hypothetical protein n=1 Tax=Gordonia sp. (in: high G+C Gram-positive bacteria) TaxID=84139 RepID=UPI0039E3F023